MFARTVTLRLKPNTLADPISAIDSEIAPILREQRGFQNHFVLVPSNGSEAIGISLWDTGESAEAYNCEAFPRVQKILSRVIEGTPQVQSYDVPSSSNALRTAGGGS
jgi:heme-degrading monooxygenase HmoA